ncbi:MAG: hypothetical protein CMJ59_20380 [Planctomycetaceae bacterium]|nr:hypothetical protein [Planctomycetaceae bacterium]
MPHAPGVPVESEDLVPVVGAQRRGQAAVAASDVHDQPARHTGNLEDLGGLAVERVGSYDGRRDDDEQEHPPCTASKSVHHDALSGSLKRLGAYCNHGICAAQRGDGRPPKAACRVVR